MYKLLSRVLLTDASVLMTSSCSPGSFLSSLNCAFHGPVFFMRPVRVGDSPMVAYT
jgi:hypothetical protein